jgi:hypothetical protein
LPDPSQHPLEAEAALLQLPERRAVSLGERMSALHAHLRRAVPAVDRLFCALYDPEMDLLKTFVSSTIGGEPLKAYQYKLSDSPSLMALKGEG